MSLEDGCANPLLLQWIGEWLENAKQHNSKGVTAYKKAYDSMKACPLVFTHPSEAQQLHGLGSKLCDRLTEKLKAHCEGNGLPMLEMPQKARKRTTTEDASSTSTKRRKKPKAYVPTYRSGPYAIIHALSSVSESSSEGLSKNEIIDRGQEYCDSSFTAPSDPTKFFTAWNSMKTLVGKELVYERGRPLRKYALTEEGWEVAKRIKAAARQETVPANVSPNEVISQAVRKSHDPHSRSFKGALDSFEESNATKSSMTLDMAALRSARVNSALSRVADETLSAKRQERDSLNLDLRTGTTATFDFGLREAVIDDLEQSAPRRPLSRNHGREVQENGNDHCDPDLHPGRSNPPEPTRPSAHPETSLPSFNPVILPSGSFTVQLVLDNREVRAKQDRDYIQEELSKRGVRSVTKSLEVGDVLWVAKCHDPNALRSHGEEGDEVMLDWIVERKRLDDLVGSIKDGRFHEQKFRLRKSGVKNVIYIIEQISMNAEHFSRYEEAVESAIASTQVVNGYFVKRTQKLDDTIRYLARMTSLLKSIYEPHPLHLLPTSILTPHNHLPLLTHLRTTSPSTPHHLSFPAFSSLASKSDARTLRDVFLRMLMCTRGVTGERAVEMQRHWDTPATFVDALARRRGGAPPGGEVKKEEADMVFEKMGALVGRRKLGKALSRKIAEVWGGAGGGPGADIS